MQEEKAKVAITKEAQNALSRQLAVYGHEAQGKIMSLRIYVHGITGLGIEVAKNLILGGPKEVALYDPNLVTIADVGRNFYCEEGHVGKSTRAEATLPSLKELNSHCNVTIALDNSIEHIVNHYDCVVMLDNYDKQYLLKLNKQCHEKGIGFILGGILGLYGYTFVDFGEAHTVIDATGEEGKVIHIAGITKQENALVCLHEEKKHGLNDGASVQFKEVKGMTEINGNVFKIEVVSPNSFKIGDTRQFSVYQSGGIALETKVPICMRFHDLEKSLRYPFPPDSREMPIADWEKFGVPEQLHIILNAIYNYFQKNKYLPRELNEEDAIQLKELVKEYQNKKMEIEGEDFKVEEVNQKLIENIARFGRAQISPCCSFWGGIITQEVFKLTGKYSPLRQWLHYECFEVLPQEPVSRTLGEVKHTDYHLLFGDEFVKKAFNSSSFLVGAGALGCQFIKMFALMGMSSQGGKVFVTDDDSIEISNLNRQFLFRQEHVGKNKSETACHVGKKMNDKCNFESLKLRVSPENEDFFNDNFWTNLNIVVNAVDNVKARQYIDGQCVWFQKPLFQSGTLGTKCHSQIIIPHATQSYTDIVDPPEESIPLCTLKNFPYQIQHTIQWARDFFEGTFAEPSSDLCRFYQNSSNFLKQLTHQHRQNPSILRRKMESLDLLYRINQRKSFDQCVHLGVNIFHNEFHNQIAQLLSCFPPDHIIEETGKPFWSGLKRVPTPLKLDFNDPLHVELIQSAANIFATIFRMPLENDKAKVIEIAKTVKLKEFVPRNIKIETDQKAQKKEEPVVIDEADEREVENLLKILSGYNVNKDHAPVAMEFEKDDPTNYHIEFMGGVSNLRARNYKIQEVDNFKVKLIAGKIIPAIATTTAMVVGAVGIEVIKYLLGKKASIFKNVTTNLALPLWVFNQPLEPIVFEDKKFDPIMNGPIKAIPGKFTKWDKIDIKGPMTLKELKDHCQSTYKIEVSMITFGSATVYSSYGADSKARLPMLVNKAIEDVTKKQLPGWKKFVPLGISGCILDGTDTIMPDIRYQI